MRKVVLNLKEERKYLVIKKLVETNGNKHRASCTLGITIKQVNRLIKGYLLEGKEFFVHGNRNRKPIHALSDEEKNKIEDLYISKYFDCTYTLFSELLATRENICVSSAEVGNILRQKYILSPKSKRITRKRIKKELIAKKKHSNSKKALSSIQKSLVEIEDAHPRQPRSIYFGEEIQIDASDHIWFGNTKTQLHAAIDDASGTVVAAFFDKQETLNGYYNVLYQILNNYGIPYKFKADRRTVFEYERKGTTSDEDNTFTQFAYACSQLGTSIETSSKPEFKARIERLFGTLQNRLNVELRLANITTIEEANAFLPKFIQDYNSKFALCIDNIKSVFEKQPNEQKINLTLSILSRRVIDKGHSISFKKKYYKLVNSVGSPIYFGQGTKCMVIEAFDKSLYATIENSIFSLEEIPKFEAYSKNFDEIIPEEPRKVYIPRIIHPWKRESFEKFEQQQKLKNKYQLEEFAV